MNLPAWRFHQLKGHSPVAAVAWTTEALTLDGAGYVHIEPSQHYVFVAADLLEQAHKTSLRTMASRGAKGGIWLGAATEEYDRLLSPKAFSMGQGPTSREAIGQRLDFERKADRKGVIVLSKGRFVMRGVVQPPEFSLSCTYAPVPAERNIEVALTLSVGCGHEIF